MASQGLLRGRSALQSVTRNALLALRRSIQMTASRSHSPDDRHADSKDADKKPRKAKTPVGRLDDEWEGKKEKMEPMKQQADSKEPDVYAAFPGGKNPVTGEIGGPRGPEPTRYGDWERKGRVIDF